MDNQEHNVITFLKTRGKEILERERSKYEYKPIKTDIEDKDIKLAKELENLKADINEERIKALEKENKKLKEKINKENEEQINKYKFYKHKYKDNKKELEQTKIDLYDKKEELVQIKEEVTNLKQEIEILRLSLNKIKEKEKRKKEKYISKRDNLQKLELESSGSNSSKEIIISEKNSSEELKTEKENDIKINYLEEIKENHNALIKENKEVIEVLGEIENIKDIIKEETDISTENEQSYKSIEINSEEVLNNNDNSEKEMKNLKIITKEDKLPEDIFIIGNYKNLLGLMSQGIKLHIYYSKLDNIYEINKKIEIWKIGINLALNYEYKINLNKIKDYKIIKLDISLNKLLDKDKILSQENKIYLPSICNTKITKENDNIKPKVGKLSDKIKKLKSYLIRKYEKYRIQQKIKNIKLGLRKIYGYKERKLRCGYDDNPYYKKKRKYKKYDRKKMSNKKKRNYKSYRNNFKKKRFKIYDKNRDRFKRNLRKDKTIGYEYCNYDKIGYYTNNYPKLKGIKYIRFIEYLEQIKEQYKNWHENKEFQ